jgi:S1-C subfamily serine protease
MKKLLKIIVLGLFFTGSAYAEFIEVKKCFKSAVYGHGNQRVGLSKNWNDWHSRFIYTGNWDICDYKKYVEGRESKNFANTLKPSCENRSRLTNIYGSEDIKKEDLDKWKKIKIYDDHIFSINTSNSIVSRMLIQNDEFMENKNIHTRLYYTARANYFFEKKENKKAYKVQDTLTKVLSWNTKYKEKNQYEIISYVGGVIQAIRKNTEGYHMGAYSVPIIKDELIIDLNLSRVEINYEVINPSENFYDAKNDVHYYHIPNFEDKFSVRTVYSCDKKSNDDGEKESGASSGTAFFISNKGYLLTNNHVVEGCKLSKINYFNKEYETNLISTDKTLDLALLKIDLEPRDFISFSNKEPKKRQLVIVAGYPLGQFLSDDLKINEGKVSSLKGFENNSNEITVDLAINPGNSGGPIVNENGQLVAVAVAGMSKDVTEGISFGIKSSAVTNFLKTNKISPDIKLTSFSMNDEKVNQLLEESTVYIFCE